MNCHPTEPVRENTLGHPHSVADGLGAESMRFLSPEARSIEPRGGPDGTRGRDRLVCFYRSPWTSHRKAAFKLRLQIVLKFPHASASSVLSISDEQLFAGSRAVTDQEPGAKEVASGCQWSCEDPR